MRRAARLPLSAVLFLALAVPVFAAPVTYVLDTPGVV